MKVNHNEIYEKLQAEYLQVKGSNSAKEYALLARMYLVCRELQRNYILDYSRKKNLTFRPEELEDKIEDATLYVIDKYLYKEDFKIDRLSAYAYFGFQKAMFKKEVPTISLESLIENGGEIHLAEKVM